MVTMTVEQIETQPHNFIEQIKIGEDIMILSGTVPLARVSGIPASEAKPLYGSMTGKVWMSDDFDAPLDEFESV
jgi:antitoxin (DNA-binding transcriptional repressor) of toxin-antitoxin stability system